ncbi:MAG: ArsC/Spx/MgsR family protein, partial [Bacteroidales bacterium]
PRLNRKDEACLISTVKTGHAPSQPYQQRYMITIYHNPSCKKSRAGLKHLQTSGKAFIVVEYLKEPLSEQDLERLLVKLHCKPEEILRKQEDYYKQQLKGKKFEDHELIKIILQNPKLLQRPVIEGKYKAVIGDPVENIDPLLK